MRGLDPALGKQKSSLGRLGLHTLPAPSSSAGFGEGWFAKLERNCQGPDATGSQQAGKPLRQGGDGKASMDTSDSKPASAFAELCND